MLKSNYFEESITDFLPWNTNIRIDRRKRKPGRKFGVAGRSIFDIYRNQAMIRELYDRSAPSTKT